MVEHTGTGVEAFEELQFDGSNFGDVTGTKGEGGRSETRGGGGMDSSTSTSGSASPRVEPKVYTRPHSGRKHSSSGTKETDSDDQAAARSSPLNHSESSGGGNGSSSRSLDKKRDQKGSWQFIGTPKGRGSNSWLPQFSFIMKHHEKNTEIHKIFSSLPDEERLVDDYSCALQRDILIHGRMYVTQKWLCFYANIFSWETILTVPFETVTSVTKEKTALLIPNAILISTTAEKYGFSSFVQRDVSYNIIFKVWQNSLLHKPLPPLDLVKVARKAWGDSTEVGTAEELWGVSDAAHERPTGMPSRQVSLPTHLEFGQIPVSTDTVSVTNVGPSSDVTAGGGRERAVMAVAPVMSVPANLSSSGKQQVGFTVPPASSSSTTNSASADSTPASNRSLVSSRRDSADPATENSETPIQPSNSQTSQAVESNMSHGSEGVHSPHHSGSSVLTPEQSPQRQEQRSIGGESNGSSDQFETCSFDEIGEVSCECPEHIGRTIINDVYSADVETLFQLLFTDSDFLRSFLASRKTTNIVMGEWIPQPDGTRLRDLTYTLALNYSFGPKFSPSSEHQVYLKNGQPGVQHIVKTEVVNGNIPYGDTFFVSCCFCITRVSHDKARLRITSNICFRKNCWGLVKNLIERNAGDGIRSYYNQLDSSLKEYLSSNPSRGLHSSVRRPPRRSRHRRQASLSKPPQPPSTLKEEEEEQKESSTNSQQHSLRQRRGSTSSKISGKSSVMEEDAHSMSDAEKKRELPGSQSLPKVNLILTVLLGVLILFNMALYRQLIGFQSTPSPPFTSPQSSVATRPTPLSIDEPAPCRDDNFGKQSFSSGGRQPSDDRWPDMQKMVDQQNEEKQRWLQSMQRVINALKEIEHTVSDVRKELEASLEQSHSSVQERTSQQRHQQQQNFHGARG